MSNQDISYTDFKLFLECELCFYFSKKKFCRRPDLYEPGPLKHIEQMIKKEISYLRKNKRVHCGIRRELSPFGLDLDVYDTLESRGWRDIRNSAGEFNGGISYDDRDRGIRFYGEIDDILMDKCSEKLVLIDYKLCDSNEPKRGKRERKHDAYQIQLSFYAWILQNSGHNISPYGYIIFCSTQDRGYPFIAFAERVSFAITAYQIKLDIGLIEHKLIRMHEILSSSASPENSGKFCKQCRYIRQRSEPSMTLSPSL